MPRVRVVLVSPKFEGNIGAVARSMANFDMEELCLVDPCSIGDEAYCRSKHGNHILDSAKTVGTLEEAVSGCFLVVGTSGVTSKCDNNYTRIPMNVKEFADKMKDYSETVAIVFGREDTGLLQEELSLCDLLVTVPTSERYPILNLSHAVTIVLYELFDGNLHEPMPAEDSENEQMFIFFEYLLNAIEYPEHRRKNTSVMFRRMMGRSIPSKWEYNTIMGVFGDASKVIEKNRRKD